MKVRSTKEVSRLLGVSPSRLSRAVWEERVRPPDKSPQGSFLWGPDDIQRAGWVLLGREVEIPDDDKGVRHG